MVVPITRDLSGRVERQTSIPSTGKLNPDHAVTAAAVLMTWLFGTRPLIQGVIRIFQSKGHDDQEVGKMKMNSEDRSALL
jgi:hypothetical protein